MDQFAVRQSPEARYAFVDCVIGAKVLVLQILTALTAMVKPRIEDADIGFRTPAGVYEIIALDRAGVVDQGGGSRPMNVV